MALTNPAVVDPNNGQVQYEPNLLQAAIDMARKTRGYVQPDQAQSATDMGLQLPQAGQPEQAQPLNYDQNTPQPPMPKVVQPTFQQAATDRNGLPDATSPALTKGGKLLTLLMAGLKGGAAGAGSWTFGQGYQTGQQQSVQNALGRGAVANQQTVNQLGQQRLQTFPWVRAQLQADLQNTQAKTAEQQSLAHLHGVQAENANLDKLSDPDKATFAYLTSPEVGLKPDAAMQKLQEIKDAGKVDPQKPISVEQAASLNAVWNPIADRYKIPQNQFREGMSSSDAHQLQSSLNNVAARTQSAVHVTVGAPGSTPNDPKDIAGAIMDGLQPPDTKGLYRNAAPVRAELARQGYDLAKANLDWQATQKYMSTLNGNQQVRMQQAITNAHDGLQKIESLYDEWQRIGPASGFKLFNRASLSTAANLPGRTGAVASNLLAQINDLASEMGNVYMGGNSPTDHALRLGATNLNADWNNETFKEALKQIRANLVIRRNSIYNGTPVGASGDNTYFHGNGTPQPQSGAIPPGATHKVPDGKGVMHWTNAAGTVDYGVAQ